MKYKKLHTIFSLIFCIVVLPTSLCSQPKYNNDSSIIKDPSGYKIRTGDKIRISIRGETESTVDVLIDRYGKARAAYLGELKVSGLSTSQVESILISEYRKQLIYKNPIVNVLVLQYSDRVVFLSGSINKKGPYVFPPEVEAMNIVEVIARAGGFSDIARKNKVFVTRTFYDKLGALKDTKTYEVNVEALSTGSLDLKSPKRFWIYPGDRIEVPERLF
jgi:protein involved in polysaccharide export with SLBB domain